MIELISYKEYQAACKLVNIYLQQVAHIAELRFLFRQHENKQAKYFNQIVHIEKIENDIVTISFSGTESEYETLAVHITELTPL